MKTVKLPGPSRELGVRLTPSFEEAVDTGSGNTGAECSPSITGLRLQDPDTLEWSETSANYYVYDPTGGWGTPPKNLPATFVPVRLLGTLCDLPVTWNTTWQVTGPGDMDPVFYGFGASGVVGWPVYSSWDRFIFMPKVGLLTITATVNGVTYGPVTIQFLSQGEY